MTTFPGRVYKTTAHVCWLKGGASSAWAGAVVCALAWMASLSAAALPPNAYRVATFLPSDGLAGEHVRSIVQTSDGQVWFACWGLGISRFDGYEWTSFDEDDGLPTKDVRSLAVDSSGRLWCGTTHGIAYFDGGRWTSVATGVPDLDLPSIVSVLALPNGTLWTVLENSVILRFVPSPASGPPSGSAAAEAPRGDWSVVLAPERIEGAPIRCVLVRGNEEAWASVDGMGLLHYVEGEWQADRTSAQRKEILALATGPDGALWGAAPNAVIRFGEEGETTIPMPLEVPSCLAFDAEGHLWVGSYRGLSVYDGTSWESVDLGEMASVSPVVTIVPLGGGVIWIGTRFGSYRITDNEWVLSNPEVPDFSYADNFLYTDPGQPPLTADTRGRLYQWDGYVWTELLRVRSDESRCLGFSTPRSGKVWVMFPRHVYEVSLTTGETLRKVRLPSLVGRPQLYTGPSGRLYLYDDRTLQELVEERWQLLREKSDDQVDFVLEDHSGELWVIWGDVCERRTTGGWVTVEPDAASGSPGPIETMTEAYGRTLLFGIAGEGIYERREDRLAPFVSFNGASSTQSNALLQSLDGTIWVGNRQAGISSYNNGFWTTHMQKRGVPAGRILYLGEDPHGTIWAGVQYAGVLRYRPKDVRPRTAIDLAPPDVSYREQAVFHFSGIDQWKLTPKEDLRYSWRVVASDGQTTVSDWTRFESSGIAVVQPLPPGDYVFQVSSINLDRNIDVKPARAAFKVLGPFWSHPGFFLPLGALAGAVALLIYLWIRKHSSFLESETKYRDIVNAISEIVFSLAPDGRVMYVSPGVGSILGYAPEEVRERPLFDFMQSEDRERFGRRIAETANGDTSKEEFGFVSRSGEIRWLRLSWKTLMEDGRPVDIKGIATDITQRKRAEDSLRATLDNLENLVAERTREVVEANASLTQEIEERRNAENALRQSEERLRLIIERSPVAMAITNDRNEIEYVNSRFVDTFGYSAEDIPNQEAWHRRAYPDPEYRRQIQETWRTIDLNTDGPGGFTFPVEPRITCKDGSVRIVQVQSAGIASKRLTILNDVTERREAEEREQLQREQSLQASKLMALGTLVSGVAHEINNPNHIILMAVSTLKRVWTDVQGLLERNHLDDDSVIGGLEWSGVREHMPQLLANLKHSSERIREIVQDLRDYAGPEAEHAKEHIDVVRVVQGAATWLAQLIAESTHEFSVECEPGIPLILGNRRRLEQVLVNLIQNACQALPSPDRAVRVMARYDRGQANVIIEVADEGVGMPAEVVKHVTDPFFTTKRSKGGTGLGLSIAAAIVREHGGTLGFASEPGKGTVARIAIPVAGPSAAAME